MGEYTGTTVYRGGPDYHQTHSADYHIHDTSNASALTFLFVLLFIIVGGMVFATHGDWFEGGVREKSKKCHGSKNKPHTHEHTHEHTHTYPHDPEHDKRAENTVDGNPSPGKKHNVLANQRSKVANLFMV